MSIKNRLIEVRTLISHKAAKNGISFKEELDKLQEAIDEVKA